MLACGSELRADKGQWLLVVEVGMAGATEWLQRKDRGLVFFPPECPDRLVSWFLSRK